MPLEFSSSGESPDLEDVISVLDDSGCREIISILETPKTASDIASEVELPLSTTYRKLDRLTEAGLATETVGVRQGSHHTARYVADFDRIAISLDENREFEVDIDRSDDQSLGIWAEATQEF